MDLKAISTNLAAQFAPGTLAPPAGLGNGMDAIRYALGQAPQGPKDTPFLVVLPRDGTVIYQAEIVEAENHLDVNFYLSKSPGDLARVETARQAWLGVLLTATNGNLAIDLEPTVLKAIPTGWEFVELPYAGDSYDGITIHYSVFVREYTPLTP